MQFYTSRSLINITAIVILRDFLQIQMDFLDVVGVVATHETQICYLSRAHKSKTKALEKANRSFVNIVA